MTRDVDLGSLLSELADFKREIVGDDSSQFAEFLNNTAEKEIFEGLGSKLTA